MSISQATFEIRSKKDAHAARLLVDGMYDAVREEVKAVEGGDAVPNDVLDALQQVRAAVRRPSTGTLTIRYEATDDPLKS